MGIDDVDEEYDWSNAPPIPGMRRMELGFHLDEKVGWNEDRVVGEMDGVVIYKSNTTFPSLGFMWDVSLKKARYQDGLSKIRKKELKVLCEEMELGVSGTKSELIDRIIRAKPSVNGVIYVDKKGRVGQKKWKPSRRILLVHDDTEEVDQVGGGELVYGRADIHFIKNLAKGAKGKWGRGLLKSPGFIEPMVIDDIRLLPSLLKKNRYDLVLISSHGGEFGLSGKGRSVSKDELIEALKESEGVGYLFITACGQAGSWSRCFEEDLGEGYWDEWYEDEDFASAIISECPVRCITVSGLEVPGGPESSLFISQMLMGILQGSTFSETLSNTMKKHPKEGYQDVPLFYTHAGDPTFKLSVD